MPLKKNVLMPEFAKEFMCTGSECPDTCCKEWTISIDKRTYNKYMTCPDPELLEKLKKHILLNVSPNTFAEMAVGGPELTCAFLTPDRMCELQRKFGYDYLCHTCKIYPREYFCVNKNIEMYLTASCPEVARHFLNENKMRFIKSDMDILTPKANSVEPQIYEDYLALRQFVIDILQDRRYIFEMRLILLGLFIQKITQNKFKNLHDTINNYRNMFRDTRVADQFFELPVMPDFQFEVINQILAFNNFSTGQVQYGILFNETLRGLGFDENKDSRQRMQSYIDALVKYEAQFLKWDHVMENYYVNTVFSLPQYYLQSLLGTENDSLWNLYLYLCLSYRLLKFHMIGIHELRGLNDTEVISVLHRFHRAVFGHSITTLKDMLNWFHEKKFDTLAYMALLIRT